MKTKKLERKINGYHRHFRGRFLLLKKGVLKDSEYLLWDLSFSVLAVWDKKHEDSYGTFELTQGEIGYYLGWSRSKVCRASKKLIKCGLWKPLDGKQIQVRGYDINEYYGVLTRRAKRIDLQRWLSYRKPDKLELKSKSAKSKPDSPKDNSTFQGKNVSTSQPNTPKELYISYKDNLGSLRSDDEYKKDSEEMGISEKDLMDMDESTDESEEIDPDDIPF